MKDHHQASSEKKAIKISKSLTKVKEKRDRSSKKRLSQGTDFELEDTIQPIFDCGVEVSAQSLEAMEEEIKQEEIEFKINDFIEQIQKQETETRIIKANIYSPINVMSGTNKPYRMDPMSPPPTVKDEVNTSFTQ